MRSRRAVAAAAVAVLAMLLAASPAAAILDLRDAEERQERLEQLLDTTLGDVELREEQVAEAEAEIAALDAQEASLAEELVTVRGGLELRARRAYMSGGGTAFAAVVSGEGPGVAVERAALLEALAVRDVATVERVRAVQVRMDQTRRLRVARVEELEQLRAELQADLRVLDRELEAAAAEVRELELLARRQRELDLPFARGIYSCPVGDPVVFRDTWGDPRSGGRTHKGVDMFAAHGTPVYAIVAGSVTRLSAGGLGGISVYLFGDDGNEYYYTHLQGYVDGLEVGDRVEPGDQIAFNGSSGNADEWAPHVHFQVHPGAGTPVNPFPFTAAACGRWTPGQDSRGDPPPTVADDGSG